MTLDLLSGPQRPPASGAIARQLIVFLHGYGADGNDLISLAPLFAEAFPHAHFTSPHAPFPCDMAPFGRQWFSLLNWSEDAMTEGADRAAPLLSHYLNTTLAQLHLHDAQMALVGFSQGTMMALQVALSRGISCAGVVGFSGALIGADQLSAPTATPPVCLIHGTVDTVVPFAAMAKAEQALHRCHIPCETHPRPGLAHGIDPEGIEHAIQFLSRRFA